MATLDPLSLELQRIEEDTQPANIDFITPLAAGIQAGGAVAGKIEEIGEIEKATQFEQLLQSGEEGMNAALADAQTQGVDITGVPDPKLYLRSKEEMANWYSLLAAKLEKHQKRTVRGEAFEQISGGEEAEKGIRSLVELGDVDPLKGAEELQKIELEKEFQEFSTGRTSLVSDEIEAPEGATAINVTTFTPARENINVSLTSRKLPEVPEDIKIAAESAAKKVGIRTDILLAIAGRESRNFDPASKNPISTATGLGQLISATGKDMFKIAQEQGLIGKDVAFEDAVVDAEMNLIMTGLLFKENLKTTGNNVRDALLAHRIGAGEVDNFNAGKRIFANKEDITDDVTNWIADVMAVSGVVPVDGLPGGAPVEENIATKIANINKDLDIIRTQGKSLLADPRMKENIRILESQRRSLEKQLIAETKATTKKKGAAFKAKKTATSIRSLLAFARQVGPTGFVTGTFKKFVAFATKGEFFPEVRTLSVFTGGLAGNIAKGIGGESGRLTDQDREFAIRMIPAVNDSKKVFATKMAFLDAVAQTLERDDLTPAEQGQLISDTIYRTAAQLSEKGKSFFTEEQFKEEYKINPSDKLIRTFILANGGEPTPENIEQVKINLEGVAETGVAARPATTLQTVDESAQIISPARGDVVEQPRTLNIPGL